MGRYDEDDNDDADDDDDDDDDDFIMQHCFMSHTFYEITITFH